MKFRTTEGDLMVCLGGGGLLLLGDRFRGECEV